MRRLTTQKMPQYMALPVDVKVSVGCQSRITLVQCRGAKSLADDLITGQGVVSSRAASILRSVETYPLIGRFVCRPGRSHVGCELAARSGRPASGRVGERYGRIGARAFTLPIRPLARFRP